MRGSVQLVPHVGLHTVLSQLPLLHGLARWPSPLRRFSRLRLAFPLALDVCPPLRPSINKTAAQKRAFIYRLPQSLAGRRHTFDLKRKTCTLLGCHSTKRPTSSIRLCSALSPQQWAGYANSLPGFLATAVAAAQIPPVWERACTRYRIKGFVFSLLWRLCWTSGARLLLYLLPF